MTLSTAVEMIDILGSIVDLLLLAFVVIVVEGRGKLPKGSRASSGFMAALRDSAVDQYIICLHRVVNSRLIVVVVMDYRVRENSIVVGSASRT